MDKVYTVLLHAGYIVFSLIFASSAVVTLTTYVKTVKKNKANAVWLSKKWLLVLFLGFGTPCLILGGLLLNRGETTVVMVTGILAAALGLLLGLKVEERLRDERLR